VGKIEKHMFEKFNDVNKEYKAKFRRRSFIFDFKKIFVWKKILNFKIA
jgi:hypothetical protein